MCVCVHICFSCKAILVGTFFSLVLVGTSCLSSLFELNIVLKSKSLVQSYSSQIKVN